jgi:SOS response regulatory protein OraA/RecX
VEKLVDRLQSSTLLDDRRDACRALKALSRTYRVEVGAQGMDALRQVLEMDKTDYEIIGLALDTLCNITSPEIFEEKGKIVTFSIVNFISDHLTLF